MAPIKTLSCDIETYSSVNLAKSGVYRYCEADDFEVLLFGYSADGGEVHIVDLAQGERIPPDVISALSDESVIKCAFNAMFERVCLSSYLGTHLKPNSWRCTMIWAATLGLPLSLEGVGAVLGLEKQKLSEGKDLIRYFCSPSKLRDGSYIRHLPSDSMEKWERFKQYNKRDVEVEMSIQARLSKFLVPESEWQNYILDQEINDRGIMLDRQIVKNAILLDSKTQALLSEKLSNLTDVKNPNSVQQIKQWLSDNGIETDSLGKKQVNELLKSVPEPLREVLVLRQQLSKSSVKKYTAMQNAVCKDGRVHGMFQFYGANRTGRYAGRLVQMQNLPANHLPDLAEARKLVRCGAYDTLRLLYEDIPDTLSQLIRTAFIPKKGCRFFVADFSAIEARVIAWLANENWRKRVFAEGGDIYCASASQMFHVPVEKNGVNGHLRQKGKIAELALGYGGSVGALKAMGALDMGIHENELKQLVDIWRAANPNIVRFWREVDRAVITCVKENMPTQTHGIRFEYKSGILFCIIPSGRRLAYVKPRIGENRFGGESVTYEGIGAARQWERLESYGAKFVENIVQATSRDILTEAMLRLNEAGYRIVMHVHDEVVIEAPAVSSLNEICTIMSETPVWADGLKLRADGYVCDFYRKD